MMNVVITGTFDTNAVMAHADRYAP